MDLDKAIGYKKQPLPVTWNQRDLLLYAVGIGARKEELPWLYELSPAWHPFPTYPLVLGLKGPATSVNNFAEMKDYGGAIPGLPPLAPEKSVHAEQTLEILRPLPKESGEGWKLISQCVGVKDTGKGLIVDQASTLVDGKGTEYARMISSSYTFGKFDANKYAKSVAPKAPAKGLGKPPASKPSFTYEEKTTEEQAVAYRLSGDYNPLHIEPSIGKAMGFGGVILHGLSTYGHAVRAIALSVTGGKAQGLEYVSARFTSPVIPGDTLVTQGWVSEEGGKLRVDFVCVIKESGKPCLGGGVAIFKKGTESKL